MARQLFAIYYILYFNIFVTTISLFLCRRLFSPQILQFLHPNSCSALHHTWTWAFGVVFSSASFRHMRRRLLFQLSQQVSTSDRSVLLLKLCSQLLHYLIIERFCRSIFRLCLSTLQSSEEEHSTRGSTRLPHSAYSSAKRRRHPQRLLFRETIHISKSCDYRLRTVEATIEKCYRLLYSFFVIHDKI